MSDFSLQARMAEGPLFQPNHFLVRKKEDQSAFKGYLWMTGGAVLAGAPPSMMVATAFFGSAALASSPVPPVAIIMAGGFVASALATRAVLEGVKTCFNNAIYHYGPQLEVVG